MKLEYAERLHLIMSTYIEDFCGDENDFKSEIYHDYSGRGMYGKTTTGLVISSLVYLVVAMCNVPDLLMHDDEPLLDITSFCVDNLGYDIIIY